MFCHEVKYTYLACGLSLLSTCLKAPVSCGHLNSSNLAVPTGYYQVGLLWFAFFCINLPGGAFTKAHPGLLCIVWFGNWVLVKLDSAPFFYLIWIPSLWALLHIYCSCGHFPFCAGSGSLIISIAHPCAFLQPSLPGYTTWVFVKTLLFAFTTCGRTTLPHWFGNFFLAISLWVSCRCTLISDLSSRSAYIFLFSRANTYKTTCFHIDL